MSQNIIELRNLHKKIEDQEVLKDINLSIKKNEFMTILGPSGCGKTTTLRILAGFETATSGEVLFNGEDLLKVPAHKRNLNTVFQSYALFPHMNVEQNIAFGLKIKKVAKAEIATQVAGMLDLVNLKGYEKRPIKSLSGGQQQRVAIARALINTPEVLLLDEPLGALDLKLRKEMQRELKKMQRKLGITFIYVTHDQEEALTMSDTVIVMNNGEILQQGTPEDIYNEPKTAFVANFIGTSNIVKGTMSDDYKVSFLDANFTCLDKMPSKNVEIVIRPEDIELGLNHEDNQLYGKVLDVVFFGVHYEMRVEVKGHIFKIHSTKHFNTGETVGLNIAPDAIHIMEGTDENN